MERFRTEIRASTRILRTQLGRALTEREISECRWKVAGRIERFLDCAHGECLLRHSELATIVRDTLNHFNEERYHLDAWCVMPNHVHVIVTPLNGHELSKILLSWKTYSAKEINKQTARRGRFWQREYYDRLIRNEHAYKGINRYILNNPVKAGMKDWAFVGSNLRLETERIIA